MVALSTFILFALALFLFAYMGTQAVRGTVDIVSTRNLFLLGLVIFQLTGPAMSMVLGARSSFYPSNLPSTSIVYTLMVSVFVVLFLVSYMNSTKIVDSVLCRREASHLHYSPAALMTIAFATIPIGLVCQFVLIYIPVFGPGFRMLSYGMYTVGSGLASWVWFKRFYHPVYMTLAITVIMMALLLTFYKNFGRRPLVGVAVGIGWAAYYSHWRSLGLSAVIKRGAVVAFGGFFLLALVTSARDSSTQKQSILQNVSALKGASFSSGAMDLVTGQQAGMTSMWLLETRPNSKNYDTLHTVYSVLTFPIPRASWPGKPVGLSISMPSSEMKIAGKPRDWNIGPGLIGHIENDNPFIALWLYPIFFGIYFRVFDRVVALFPENPFAVLPMGAALGQIIAMPRGELGSFFFIANLNVFGALAIMISISFMLKLLGFISYQADDEELYYDDGYDQDDNQYDYYGDDQSTMESG